MTLVLLLVGGAIGAIVWSQVAARTGERLRALERRIAALEARARVEAPGAPASEVHAGADERTPPMPATSVLSPSATVRAAPTIQAAPAYLRESARAPTPLAAPRAIHPAWRFVTSGNSPARVGIVLLFIGVGFLLKYAALRVHVPIEVRLGAVALGGAVLLVLGWRLRATRRSYSTILEGGGIGILYLATFAAFRLYALVAAPFAFVLLAVIGVFAALLAVRQDAIALATVGVLGGFLAPVLTSAQTGNHVVLFGYYALLDAGIFAIAWFRAWRVLNLLGFACTFVAGVVFGVTRYRPGDFATTEPFLVLFFVFYVAIAVLYAWRRSVALRDYVDATLVFGTPLVVAVLQQALVQPYPYGMAYSALAAALLYLALAYALGLRRRDDLRLLRESFAALGVAFATLAVPLAFDAHLTSATWALEGAAITWTGVRQQRRGARAFGLALQCGAAAAFAFGAPRGIAIPGVRPLLDADFIGALVVAAGGLASAFVYARHRERVPPPERVVESLAFAWGCAWWTIAGVHEIERFVAPAHARAALVAFATGSALAFAAAWRALAWPIARIPALLLAPALLAYAALDALPQGTDAHLLADGGALAWPLALVAIAALLYALDRESADGAPRGLARVAHAAFAGLLCITAADEAAWVIAQVTQNEVWTSVPWGASPALGLAVLAWWARRSRWPVARHPVAYLDIAGIGIALWALGWSLAVGVASDGDLAPVPYVPIANPLDLALVAIAVAILAWSAVHAASGTAAVRMSAAARIALGAPFAFAWINAAALRALHHAFGIAWSLPALWESTLVQATLSLLWAAIALAAMVLANRVHRRGGWLAGAGLLAVVVAKLFAVDLSRAGSVERIVSFIGVGVLLLAIGYFAPVPSEKQKAS